MKNPSLAYLGFALLLGLSRSLADAPPALVKEAVHEVHYGSSQSTIDTHSAPAGTLIHDGQFVGTGKDSRAELALPSQSITRLGQYTIFNYSEATNTVDLQQGAILFCKPKDAARTLNIKTGAVMAGIVGTTGFYSVQTDKNTGKTTYLLGLVEGHSTVHADGQGFDIKGGQELQFAPPSHPVVFTFDVPKFVKTSKLFTGFKGHLPNQKYIDREIADYNDKVGRGFIQPANGSQTNTNYAGIPTLPATAFDSAQNAQGDQSKGGPPPINRSGPP